MKKSYSNPKHLNVHSTFPQNRTLKCSKNKTTSTIVHTENQPLSSLNQQTTKKNSLAKVGSCAKMGQNSSCKTSKSNLIKIQPRNSRVVSSLVRGSNAHINRSNAAAHDGNLVKKNQQLDQQNKILKQQFCKLQQSHLKDKAKIQHLLTRMSQLKSNPTPQTDTQHDNNTCKNQTCRQKRRLMQLQLHREHIKVYELEQEKKKWEKSKQHLKEQYSQLLMQIQMMKDRS